MELYCCRCNHEIHNGFCEENDCGCDRDNFPDLLDYIAELEAELITLRTKAKLC